MEGLGKGFEAVDDPLSEVEDESAPRENIGGRGTGRSCFGLLWVESWREGGGRDGCDDLAVKVGTARALFAEPSYSCEDDEGCSDPSLSRESIACEARASGAIEAMLEVAADWCDCLKSILNPSPGSAMGLRLR